MGTDATPPRRQRKRWSDLSNRQQAAVIAAGIIQVGLAAGAWVDLARRPADQVAGPKAAWAAAIAVNFVGPVTYFIWGRRGAAIPALPPAPSSAGPG